MGRKLGGCMVQRRLLCTTTAVLHVGLEVGMSLAAPEKRPDFSLGCFSNPGLADP